jgi:hypothetical protein
VLPDLALGEAAFGLPAGFANVGRSAVSIEYEYDTYEFWFEL